MRFRLFAYIFIFSITFSVTAQNKYSDNIFQSNIKTVLLHNVRFPLSDAVIFLDSDEKLQLSFDAFSDVVENYKYTLIHCDANWEETDLPNYDYLIGFNEDYIDNYEFSINTIQKYIHYSLVFPTENLKPKLSGNYIIKVFHEDEIEKAIITAKFKIFEQKVKIDAKAKRPLLTHIKRTKQEIDFSIHYDNYKIENPFRDILVVITQNNRDDNAKVNLKPKDSRNSVLNYNYDDERNLFNGGNEFRHFDTKSLKYQSRRMETLSLNYDTIKVKLLLDKNRIFDEYIYNEDIDGKRLIKTEDYTNSDIEADYIKVHFSFPVLSPFVNDDLYIYGDLTYRQFSPEYKMKYNYHKKLYEVSLYLKQGYYNYKIAYLNKDSTEADMIFFEGNHVETDNEYAIYVYHRAPNIYYDRLIGMAKFRP